MSAAQGDVGAEGLSEKRLAEIEHWASGKPSCHKCDDATATRKHAPHVCPMAKPPSVEESLALAAEVRRLRAMLAPVQEAAREYRAQHGSNDGMLSGHSLACQRAALATIADEKGGVP